jgi:hypothetical protein
VPVDQLVVDDHHAAPSISASHQQLEHVDDQADEDLDGRQLGAEAGAAGQGPPGALTVACHL